MNSRIVLELMQIKGISRKTIIKYIPIDVNTKPGAESIRCELEKASYTSKRVKVCSSQEIIDAVYKTDKIIEDCDKLGIRIITYLDDEYPILLKKSTDYPAVLYYKGDISYINSMNAVAIVGTRAPSEYGKKFAYALGKAMSEREFVDVSGLAIGCDTEGHIGCLDAGGKTIAVLAGGLESVYPAENKKLAERIVENGGALVSEYPPYSEMFRSAFVQRDRIQAGMSNAVFVVETREKGGTINTVNFAREYNRPIACLRHSGEYANIEESAGNRMFIAEGIATGIGNNDDLNEFCELIKTIPDSDDGEKAYKQMSLMDICEQS